MKSLKEIVEGIGKIYKGEGRLALYTLGVLHGTCAISALTMAAKGDYEHAIAFASAIPITHCAFYKGYKVRQDRRKAQDAIVRI